MGIGKYIVNGIILILIIVTFTIINIRINNVKMQLDSNTINDKTSVPIFNAIKTVKKVSIFSCSLLIALVVANVII